MAGGSKYCGWAVLVLGLGAAGCGKSEPTTPTTTQAPAAETQPAAAATASATAAPASAATPVTAVGDPGTPATGPAAKAESPAEQSLADATLPEPPDGAQRPPDKTITGLATGKVFTEITRAWETIHFTSPAGKPLAYRAVLETELGSITIALRPDLAPNHVRNFIALARAGYYDGLVFERIVREAMADQPDATMERIEAGCPLGTGELGYGSIGYWLKPEISNQIRHEEGTVGACHTVPDEPVAACRFYINLSKAPAMDDSYSVFGKVTDGLDVAKQILVAPTRTDAESPANDRPVKPVVIRKVTITATETP